MSINTCLWTVCMAKTFAGHVKLIILTCDSMIARTSSVPLSPDAYSSIWHTFSFFSHCQEIIESQKVLCAWSTANPWFHQHNTPKAAVDGVNSWPPLCSEQDLDTSPWTLSHPVLNPHWCNDGKMQKLFKVTLCKVVKSTLYCAEMQQITGSKV